MLKHLLLLLQASLRSRRQLSLENIALRHQLAVLQRNAKRPRLKPTDRALWAALSRILPDWRRHLAIVQPDTVVGWHRAGWRLYWRWRSRPGRGRPPVSADELEDLVAVLAKPDPRVPSNWSRRFKNHQEKLKSGDVYQVAEVVRNLAARNRDASLSAAERTMYERARVNLISEISPALKVSSEDAEVYLDEALAKGVLKDGEDAVKKK